MGIFFWEFGGVQGAFPAAIGPLEGVTKNSIVVASITEILVPPGSSIGSDDNIPFLGDANNMLIKNVVPEENGVVTMMIDTGWSGGPINIRLCIAVMGDI